MEATLWEQAQSLFHQATELAEGERAAFLDAACEGNDALKAEVLAMLEADASDSPILDHGLPVIANQFLGDRREAVPVREIGPYKLLRILGEGGMGVVWQPTWPAPTPHSTSRKRQNPIKSKSPARRRSLWQMRLLSSSLVYSDGC